MYDSIYMKHLQYSSCRVRKWNIGFQRLQEGTQMESYLFNEHRVYVGEDKKVLGIDSGDEYTHCINAIVLYTYNS